MSLATLLPDLFLLAEMSQTMLQGIGGGVVLLLMLLFGLSFVPAPILMMGFIFFACLGLGLTLSPELGAGLFFIVILSLLGWTLPSCGLRLVVAFIIILIAIGTLLGMLNRWRNEPLGGSSEPSQYYEPEPWHTDRRGEDLNFSRLLDGN